MVTHHDLLRTGHELELVVKVFQLRNEAEILLHGFGRSLGGLAREEVVGDADVRVREIDADATGWFVKHRDLKS